MKNIILAGGGTAGHIMPNVALLPYLNEMYDNVYYVGGASSLEENLAQYYNIPFYPTRVAKLERRKLHKNFKIPFVLINGIKDCKKIIELTNPSVIYCKGGYATLPIAYAGKSKNIPVICHESDMTLGLANKLISKFSVATFTSYQETEANNAIYTGLPLRDNINQGNKLKAKKYLNFTNNLPYLLIVGGSQGAKAINDCIISIKSKLIKKFNIIHITGKNGKNINTKNYRAMPYTNEIENFYALADIIVSRAGATACAELNTLNKKVLLIPLPKGNSRGDQILNAEYYYQHNVANILYQEEMNSDRLYNSIMETFEQKKNKSDLKPASTCDIARLIYKYNK